MSSASIRQVRLLTNEKLVAALWLRETMAMILRRIRSLSINLKKALVWMILGALEI